MEHYHAEVYPLFQQNQNVMLSGFKNTKKQSDAGVGLAIAYFTMLGLTVSIPLTDSQDYDLVVEIDGVLKKVQVKTTNMQESSGSYAVSLRILGGNAKANFVSKHNSEMVYDLLFVVTGDGSKYLIPRETLAHLKSAIVLGKKYDHYRL